jgi:glycosyltransferase involved in cell wall biosynthesis
MNPKISIMMPVYNREHYLRAAIASVLQQTLPDFELLICDDGSTDDSLAIARHYAERDSRVQVFTSENRGPAQTLKAGFAKASGIYIGSVDSDDLLAPTALEETTTILDAYPEVGFVYTNYEVIDANGNLRGLGKRCQIPYSKNRLLIDFMTFHFRLIRRTVYEQVGGIDETCKYAEDYDLCLRLSEVTQVCHLSSPLYSYRRHSENMTNQKREVAEWTYKASLKAMKRRGLDQLYQLELDEKNKFVLSRKQSS